MSVEKHINKTYDLYNKLQLEVLKKDAFEPVDIINILTLGIKGLEKFKHLNGQQKKEELLKIIKLLIKEHAYDSFDTFDIKLIDTMINDLCKNIKKKGCCF
jgi:hypothetical protein